MEINELQDRIIELERELRDEHETQSDLAARLEAAYETGHGDAQGLVTERRESQDRIEALETALSGLRTKLDDARSADHVQRAEARVLEIGRILNGSANEQPRRIQRLAASAEAFVAEASKVSEAYERQQDLLAEVQALRARFPELPMIDPQLMAPPATEQEILDIKRAVRDVAFTYSRRRGRRGAPSDSPGAQILDEAGPSESELRAQEEADRKRREREAREQREMAPFVDAIRSTETALDAVSPRVVEGPADAKNDPRSAPLSM